jgi:glycosyltransferase involved in cell wall biosynthesis
MKGVRYISLAENSGYGIAAQGNLRSLLRAGVTVEWYPLVATPQGYQPWNKVNGATAWIAGLADERSSDSFFGEAVQRTLDRDIDYDTVIIHCTPEHWPRYADPGKRNIGYTVWETDAPPPHWKPLMNSVDRVLVPSRFNQQVFYSSGIVAPIDVVPHIVRPVPVEPSAERVDRFRDELGIRSEQFIFYTIEAWTPRKALWKTIHAFLQAFDADDPVSLVVKTGPTGPRSSAAAYNSPTETLVQELVSHYERAPNVVLIDHEMTAVEIELLHHVGDCYLSLAHSEGWGLSVFDAAASGNPVIVTGWGGHLDYLGARWPYLIDFEMTPVMDAQGRGSYMPTQNWAAPSIDDAVRLMHEVHENPGRARAHAAARAERIAIEFGEEAVGRRLLDILDGGS